MPTPKDPAKVFAGRIKHLRGISKLNQAQLADASGLTPAAISQIEAGERVPAFNTILALAKALKTTPDDLLGMKVQGLDPDLQELSALFRDLKQVSPEDLEKVKAFAQWLIFENKSSTT